TAVFLGEGGETAPFVTPAARGISSIDVGAKPAPPDKGPGAATVGRRGGAGCPAPRGRATIPAPPGAARCEGGKPKEWLPTMECEMRRDRAARFRELHRGPSVLQLVNVWDPWSARTAAATGAVALGTSSFAVAAAAGMPDGERMPWPHVRAVVAGVVDAVDV